MLAFIKNILDNNKEVSDYIIKYVETESKEVFLIEDKIDMNRYCLSKEYLVKIYVDFDVYRGNASVNITVSDSFSEIEAKIKSAISDAKYVRNKFYPLPFGKKIMPMASSNVVSKFKENFDAIYDVFFREKNQKVKINSLELFAKEKKIRLLASNGVDTSYGTSNFLFELVTEAKSEDEDVEIFNFYSLSDIKLDEIKDIIQRQVLETEKRCIAKKNLGMQNTKLILSSNDVENFFAFYLAQASDQMIFNKISKAKLGEKFLIGAEKINLRINPFLANAVDRRPVDDEANALVPYVLYKDNVLVNLISGAKYSHYLGIENLGSSKVFELDGGRFSEAELRQGNYIEILAFSSFFMDETTGDFGGEFRLARQVKDGIESFITSGSISLNIFDLAEKMFFSSETKPRFNSLAPCIVVFEDVNIVC